ncbi:MAG TPA: glycerophosphodiester phosphodiesterase family protein, partial [Pyrinomonadaceae bacterium]|nr:glycerophosphodiester phosphodiesterase family protein [Pyrinomonadaceae bacterium]
FKLAIDHGADGIEFDVRLTADRVPVIIHDANLRRTALRDGLVSQLASSELAAIDAGSWFNKRFPKKARQEFAAQTIPSLAQTLEFLSDFKGRVYIELKAGDRDFRQLAEVVCREIGGSRLLPQIIVKSFKLAAIPEIKHRLPDVAAGALFSAEIIHFLRSKKHIVALAREFGADHISLHRSLATRDLARAAAEAGMPVTVWTADTPQWIDRSRKLGVEALITNDPEKLIRYREESATGVGVTASDRQVI